ncbi:FAD binding domain-containing protein [Pleurostoma richardsiae]|uniref:FAD binding domain-containing protein n=1 Tax=Pleurostoma richardsiae TaxID=41990 RepID=A0AA38RG37_9PEZI|nr:FAD binding domain-containing protein [Pleurostoma richardsiae]
MERVVDVLVAGSGAAGLTAAATAASLGLEVLLIEKQDKIGGTTSYSGGIVWVPDNPISKDHGIRDSCGELYMNNAIRDSGCFDREMSQARRRAYLRNGPEMIRLLIDLGFKWATERPIYPDYHPALPGARPEGGRTLHPAIFDAASLGQWREHLIKPASSTPLIDFQDLRIASRPLSSPRDLIKVLWMLLKSKVRLLLRPGSVSMGYSLVAQLLFICTRQTGKLTIEREAELISLIPNRKEEGAKLRAIVETARGLIEVEPRCGVVLATAGFARDEELRALYLRKPSETKWSLTHPGGDSGDGLRRAMAIGGQTTMMKEAWFIPTMADPVTGRVTSALFEMSKPYCIVVDRRGRRCFSEAQPYGDIGHSMYEHEAVPSWLILDWNHRSRYMLGSLWPYLKPTAAVKAGDIFEGNTLDELARQIDVDATALRETVTRWNEMCETGEDADFRKGDDAYQRFIGDENVKPNANMGPIKVPPFYALEVWPGDAGTKGGLVTDEHARVLDEHGMVIPGLYAAGNVTASVMEESCFAAGVTLGPALTFAYIAAQHMRAQLP